MYLNEFSKSHFTILYMTESENGMDYNIKDNPDKFMISIICFSQSDGGAEQIVRHLCY